MKKEILVNSRVGWRFIGDEIAAFNCDNQQIVIWNETASRIWEKIVESDKVSQLVDWLATEYSVNRNRAAKDINFFLQELVAMGFINFDYGLCRSLSHLSDEGENVLLTIEMEAIRRLIPFAVTFETTYSCNECCIHCYMEKNLPALKIGEIKRILTELAEAGCLFLSLTGGEIFTRSDATEIIHCAGRLHFAIDILTNGSLINREIVRALTKYPIRRVQVSLYGATDETHDAITRVPGSFKKTIKGIEALKESSIKVEIAFTLMNQNFQERNMVRKLAKSMDCLLFPSHIITARNNGSKDTLSLRLDDDQLKDFMRDDEFFRFYGGRRPFQDHQFYLGFSNLLDAAPCYSGFNSCAITPDGKILPCNQLLYEVGDLKEKAFIDIWNHSLQFQHIRSLKLRDLKKCSNCKLLRFCSRCPGLALLEGGDLLGISPENCRITNLSHQILEERR